MHKKIFYAIPAVLGAGLFIGGLVRLGKADNIGETLFMLIMGAIFLFVSYRKFSRMKDQDDDSQESGKD